MKELNKLISRLKRIGIDIRTENNFPWIYLMEVNGEKVTDQFCSSLYFTIALMSTMTYGEIRFTDLGEMLKIIRKYSGRTKK